MSSENVSRIPGSLTFNVRLTIPSSLILPYHKNLLSFSFQGINLRNPEKVVFKSRLLGLSDDWSPPSNNREAVFPNLKPGNYQFEVMAANEDLKWNERPAIFAFSITPAIWVTWWFRILVAGIVISITLLLFRLRLRQVRKEGENQRRKIEMEKQMLELEQKALRLQMNPHFIFNALNSIKGCMAMNDTVAARENLVKFARLMRLILDNSRNSVISLDKEILTIELYLELEKLNRSSSFNYSLSVSENIVPEDIFIPPMILQPFIENAVIHGVGGLTSGGEISIRFSKLNKRLLCEISDNGPGMKADKSRKSIEPGHHSAGIEVTRERLEMLDPEMKIEFSNLQQDAEINKGTRVQIQLPLDLE